MAVALGNWLAAADPADDGGKDAAVQALAAALDDPEPLVRGHAAWALGRAEDTEQALQVRLEVEVDPWVREEIEESLHPGVR